MEKTGSPSSILATFFDSRFLSTLARDYGKFKRSKNRESFAFSKRLRVYFSCTQPTSDHGMAYYIPYHVRKQHWVGLCVNCREKKIIVLDCNQKLRTSKAFASDLRYLCVMVPYILKQIRGMICSEVVTPFAIVRPSGLVQNSAMHGSSLTAMLLMQAHAVGGFEACKSISPATIKKEAERVAVMLYEYHQLL